MKINILKCAYCLKIPDKKDKHFLSFTEKHNNKCICCKCYIECLQDLLDFKYNQNTKFNCDNSLKTLRRFWRESVAETLSWIKKETKFKKLYFEYNFKF